MSKKNKKDDSLDTSCSSPSIVIMDERNGRRRHGYRRSPFDHRFGEHDEMEDEMSLVSVAEVVSEAVVEEICQAARQTGQAALKTVATPADRLEFVFDEKERVANFVFVKDDDRWRNDDIDGESSSSEEPDGDPPNTDGALTDSETSKESNPYKDNPHYFDTDFEDDNTSGIESVVDTIEYYARSFSGFSYLSDLGFEDPGDREVFNIEEKVIKEYGMDYIKKFEKKIQDEDEPNSSTDGSSGGKSEGSFAFKSNDKPEDKFGKKSWKDGENDKAQGFRQTKEDSSFSEYHTTVTTTAEILDDIINAEREGKEVIYDPTKKESSGRSLKRSLNKSLGMIRSSSLGRSFRRNTKSGDGKEIKMNMEPEDALANRAAAVSIGTTEILDDIRHQEDDANATEHNTLNVVVKNGGNRNNNHVSTRSISNYSYADADAAVTKEIPKQNSPQRREKITILVTTTTPHVESFVQDPDSQETVLNSDSVLVSSTENECRSCTNDDMASQENDHSLPVQGNIPSPRKFVTTNGVNNNGPLHVESDNIEEKKDTNKTAINFEEIQSEDINEQQNFETIHCPNGPLIRTSSRNRKTSTDHGIGICSEESHILYDNKEVLYDPTAFVETHSQISERKNHSSFLNLEQPTIEIDSHFSFIKKNHNSCCDLRFITNSYMNKRETETPPALSNHNIISTQKGGWKTTDNAEHQHLTSSLQCRPEGVETELIFDALNGSKIKSKQNKELKQDKNWKKMGRIGWTNPTKKKKSKENFKINEILPMSEGANSSQHLHRPDHVELLLMDPVKTCNRFLGRSRDGQLENKKSNSESKSVADTPTRPTFGINKRRFLDPERLLCGLKHSKSRIKDDRLAVESKISSEETNQTLFKDRRAKISSKSKRKSHPDVAKAANHYVEDSESLEKENANNISIETATTAATSDEDDSSQVEIEVMDLSTLSVNGPLVSPLLLQNLTVPSKKHEMTPKVNNSLRPPPLGESLSTAELDRVEDNPIYVGGNTKIRVTTEIKRSDGSENLHEDSAMAEKNSTISCLVPILPEAQSINRNDLASCPIPSEIKETNSNYGSDLVDILRKVSSIVDGIVETNNYSAALPTSSFALVGKNGGGKGNKNDMIKNKDDAKPFGENMLDEIYIPTNRTPRRDRIYTTESNTLGENRAGFSSLFENSSTGSEGRNPNHDEKSNLPPKTPPQSLLDDDVSEESAIVGSSNRPSSPPASPPEAFKQPREEFQQRRESEIPVVYHMSSSPPEPKRLNRDAPKRIILKGSTQTYPPLSKNTVKNRSALAHKVKRLDDDDYVYPIGGLAQQDASHLRPKGLLEKKPSREETTKSTQLNRQNSLSREDNEDVRHRSVFNQANWSSQQQPLQPTSKKGCPSYRERHRPPTPPRGRPTATRMEIDQSDIISITPTGIEGAVNGGDKCDENNKESLSYTETKGPPIPLREKLTTTHRATLNRAGVACTNTNTEGKTSALRQTAMEDEEIKSESGNYSNNKFVVDENGFLLDRTAALLEDLEKRKDAATFHPYEPIVKPALEGEESTSDLPSPNGANPKLKYRLVATNGDRPRKSLQIATRPDSFKNNYPYPIKSENSLPSPVSHWKAHTSKDLVLQARDRPETPRMMGISHQK